MRSPGILWSLMIGLMVVLLVFFLDMVWSKIVDIPNNMNDVVIKSANNYVISKSLMENGEFSIIKSFKATSSLTASECLNRLSFEAKVLSYVGFHENIVSCHGISIIDSNPSLILSYESNLTLHDYLKQNQVLTTEFLIRVLSMACFTYIVKV